MGIETWAKIRLHQPSFDHESYTPITRPARFVGSITQNYSMLLIFFQMVIHEEHRSYPTELHYANSIMPPPLTATYWGFAPTLLSR